MSCNLIKKMIFISTAIAVFFVCSNLQANEDIVWEKNLGINNAFFSPDGSKIYATTTSKFYILDTETGEVLQEYENAYGDIIGISPDGLYVYMKSYNIETDITNYFKVILDSYEQEAKLDCTFKVSALSDDCSKLVIASSFSGYYEPISQPIKIINPQTMEEVRELRYPG